jgi:protein gp37
MDQKVIDRLDAEISRLESEIGLKIALREVERTGRGYPPADLDGKRDEARSQAIEIAIQWRASESCVLRDVGNLVHDLIQGKDLAMLRLRSAERLLDYLTARIRHERVAASAPPWLKELLRVTEEALSNAYEYLLPERGSGNRRRSVAMGERTEISWCDHTFNTHEGCEKVSPGCTNCYAASLNEWLRGGENWGPKSPRRFFGDAHWAKPLRWNRSAQEAGIRRRVFCASVGDVFEDRPDLDGVRERLWNLIDVTPALDWLLLTKRPENVATMIPWLDDDEPMPNAWLGVTAENDEYATKRIPILLKHRDHFAKLFVSYEPALGPINWARHFAGRCRPDWVIFGDESGRKRRPAELEWARSTRDACAKADIAFHFKQWCGDAVDGIAGDRDGKRKIHLPMLDGVQHAAFPEVSRG